MQDNNSMMLDIMDGRFQKRYYLFVHLFKNCIHFYKFINSVPSSITESHYPSSLILIIAGNTNIVLYYSSIIYSYIVQHVDLYIVQYVDSQGKEYLTTGAQIVVAVGVLSLVDCPTVIFFLSLSLSASWMTSLSWHTQH